MLSQAKIEEVRRLLTEGKSQRQAALLAEVSRGTVGRIASGLLADRVVLPQLDEPPPSPSVRCPDCGGRVFAPCVVCRIRRIKADERADRRRMADRILRTRKDDRRRNDPTFGS